MRKKFATSLVAIIACLLFSGCGDNTLKIGMNIGYGLFSYYGTDGVTTGGFEIELANELSTRLAMPLEITDVKWSEVYDKLDNKEFDCLLSAITVTDKKSADYAFSTPYAYAAQSIVCLTSKLEQFSSIEALDKQRIGFLAGSPSEDFISAELSANSISANIYKYTNLKSCFEDLASGAIDAIVCDDLVAYAYTTEGSGFSVALKGSNKQPIAACLRTSDTKLLEKINAALDEMKEDGTLDKLSAKYFGN